MAALNSKKARKEESIEVSLSIRISFCDSSCPEIWGSLKFPNKPSDIRAAFQHYVQFQGGLHTVLANAAKEFQFIRELHSESVAANVDCPACKDQKLHWTVRIRDCNGLYVPGVFFVYPRLKPTDSAPPVLKLEDQVFRPLTIDRIQHMTKGQQCVMGLVPTESMEEDLVTWHRELSHPSTMLHRYNSRWIRDKY